MSGEILSKTTAKHSRNKSEVRNDTPTTPPDSPQDFSPASAVQKWFSNILKPSNQAQVPNQSQPTSDPTPQNVPPRQPGHRRSRFQNDPSSPRPHGIPVPSRRTFQSPSTTPDNKLLSPPKNLVPSAHRRSISSSTCSVEKAAIKTNTVGWPKDEAQAQDQGGGIDDVNGFLKEQRTKIRRILDGQGNSKARIVLSDPSNSKFLAFKFFFGEKVPLSF